MSAYDLLPEIKRALQKCMKCGNCQAVCPLYQEKRTEAAVARGKLQLIQAVLDGQLSVSKGFQEKIDLCMLCGACMANCPNGVKVYDIILAARAEVARDIGVPAVKNMAFHALRKPGLFDFGMKTGRHFQFLALKKHPDKNAASLRFPIGLDRKRIFPFLAPKTLREELPEVNSVPNPKMRVAYFTGCTTNYIYTDIGKAVVNVLNKNGIEVVIPAKQHCCGTPVYTSGEIETAREMAKSNIDILLDLKVDAVITSCATCGGALKHDYYELLADSHEYSKKAQQLSEKVYDISQFLVDLIDFRKVKMGTVKCKTTYHDPCHLNRFMGVTKQPREIIRSIPGVEFAEMEHHDRCCGGAGSFSLTHYEDSMAVFRQKAEDVKTTGADLVLTGCPSCRMQLEDGLNHYDLNKKVMHTVQLLSMAYDKAQ